MCKTSTGIPPKYWLFIIVLAGAAVRLTAGWVQPAFIDEGFVYYVTKAGWRAMVDVLRYDTHTPVHNVLMYPWVCATDSIFWLRLPSALCGLGAVVLSYHLARRYCSAGTSLALSAFMALSYNVWLADAQLRNYGPLTLLCTVQLLCCSDIYRRGAPFADLPWSRLRWPLYALTALLCSGIHVLGALTQSVMALFSFWLPSPAKKNLLVTSILAVLPCVLWFTVCRSSSDLAMVHEETREYALQFCFTPLYLLNLKSPNDLVNYFGHYLPGETIVPFILPAYLLFNGLFWLVLLYSWYKLVRRWKWEGWLLGGVFFLPQLEVLLSCLLGMQPYSPRYAVPMTISFLLLCEQWDSEKLKLSFRQLALGWTVFLCLIFPFFPPLWLQYWQGAIDFIEAKSRPGDIVLLYNPGISYSFVWAYDPQGAYYEFSHDSGYHSALRQRPESPKLTCLPLSESLLTEDFLRSVKDRRVFLVLCQRFQGDHSLELLDKRFKIADSYKFSSLTSWAEADVFLLENVP